MTLGTRFASAVARYRRVVVPSVWRRIGIIPCTLSSSAGARSAIGCTRLVLTLAFVAMASLFPTSLFAVLPALPRVYMDTSYVPPTGRTIAVPAGGDVQAALDAAQPGDVITLQAGATFTGPFTLPNKTGTGWIIIRTSAPDSSLPPPGTRVTPSYTNVMPKLQVVQSYQNTITTTGVAHHYRFIGIEFRPAPGSFVTNIIMLGTGTETSETQLPHDIIFDRVYIHGDPTQGARQGILINGGRSIAVIDSYLSGMKDAVTGAQSQAIDADGNTAGPIKIVNNYLEGASENVIFGPNPPSITNLNPYDIEIRRNHFDKPLSWKSNDPSWDGGEYNIGNLLEFKRAVRVLIEANVFEHSWAGIHNGVAMVITPRNSSDGVTEPAPWAATQDITIRNNIIRHVGNGITISGRDYPIAQGGFGATQITQRILIQNNIFDDIDGIKWTVDPVYGATAAQLFQIYNGVLDLTIEHNTAFPKGAFVFSYSDEQHTGFTFRNNLTIHGSYGIFDPFAGYGDAALDAKFLNAIFTTSAFIGPYPTDGGMSPSYYAGHPGNFFPNSSDDVGFMNWESGDYRLAASSPYKHMGTDGKDIGVDFDALTAAMGGGDTTPPSVSLSSPTSGSTVSGVVNVAVSATDDVGVTKIEYALDGSLIAAFSPPVSSSSWDSTGAQDGPHTLTVTAYDAAGNTAQASVSFTVRNQFDTTAPSVSVLSPPDGTRIGRRTKVGVQAADDVGLSDVKVYGDSTRIGTVRCSGAYCSGSVTWRTSSVTHGPHTISAVATDTSGNSRSSTPITVYK